MTDVIGTLSFALHAAHKVYNMLESIKDATGDVQTLRENALHVRGLLKIMLDSKDSREAQNVQDIVLVQRAETVVAAVDEFIGKTTREEDGERVIKKLKWPLYAGEARKLSAQFHALYLSLTATSAVSTSCVFNSSLVPELCKLG